MTKRQLPPPHSRPSISLGSSPRAWQDLTWGDVEVGDIVPDKGRVDSVTFSPNRKGVTVVFPRSIVSVEATSPVKVFTRRRDA